MFLKLQGILFLYCKVNLIEEIRYRLFFVKQIHCANIMICDCNIGYSSVAWPFEERTSRFNIKVSKYEDK